MNPYLEAPSLWPGVHAAVIYCLNVAINRELPPGFAARMNERVYITGWNPAVTPDVSIVQRPRDAVTGTAAVAERTATAGEALPRILRVPSMTNREVFIEVVSRSSGHVVAVIELLSLSNKEAGRGREEYRHKQQDLLYSETHLLEIDLLRGGEYTLAPLEPRMHEEFGTWDYAACLHRAGRLDEFEVWPLSLRDRLPFLRVPLSEGMDDISIDLQAAFDRAFNENSLDFGVDYTAEPEPPLRAEDAVWTDALLREKGRR
jgi:hypothetical protein